MRPADSPAPAAFVARADALRVGDRVRTTAHRWETVTALATGDQYSRSTRVTTDYTGPEMPWEWVNGHRVIVQRPTPAVVQLHPTGTATAPPVAA
jgi:acetyl esterase/lipase